MSSAFTPLPPSPTRHFTPPLGPCPPPSTLSPSPSQLATPNGRIHELFLSPSHKRNSVKFLEGTNDNRPATLTPSPPHYTSHHSSHYNPNSTNSNQRSSFQCIIPEVLSDSKEGLVYQAGGLDRFRRSLTRGKDLEEEGDSGEEFYQSDLDQADLTEDMSFRPITPSPTKQFLDAHDGASMDDCATMMDSVHLTPGKSLTSPPAKRNRQHSPTNPASTLSSISFPLPASWAAPLCTGFGTHRYCLSEYRQSPPLPGSKKNFIEFRIIARIEVMAAGKIETILCSVWRRYSDFARLTRTIAGSNYSLNLPFPSKQVLPNVAGRYKSSSFLLHRQALLQRWLWTILECHSARLRVLQNGRRRQAPGGVRGDTATLMADVLLKRFLLPPSGGGGEGGGGGLVMERRTIV